MGLGQTAYVFVLVVCIVLYLGGVRVAGNDILSNYQLNTEVGIDQQTTNTPEALKQNGCANNNCLYDAIPQNPESGQSGVQTSIQSAGFFLDGLRLIWNIIKLLFNVLASPLALFSAGLPMELTILLCIPISFLQIMGIIALIRGTFSW